MSTITFYLSTRNPRWRRLITSLGLLLIMLVAQPALADIPQPPVAAGSSPLAVAVNPVTNKIYVANEDSDNVTVIDGSDNSTSTVAAGTSPYAVVVNPVTNKIYVANHFSDNVTAITPARTEANPLTTAITPFSDNRTIQPHSVFTFTATSSYSPTVPPVQQIYYQMDTWTGPWLAATPAGAAANGQMPPGITPGLHIVYAFAVDGQDATSINTGKGSSPNPGQITAYQFLVTPYGNVYLPLVMKN